MEKGGKNTRKSVNYDSYLELINQRDDLLVGMTFNQLKIAMEKNAMLPRGKRLRPSHVKLKWKCKAENHEFTTPYYKIKNIGQKCPKCQKTSYKNYLKLVKRRPDLVIGMTPNHFKTVMEENNKLPQENRLRPSYVKLIWKCEAKEHTWSASYHNVKAGTKCPFCSIRASITYENYLEVVNERNDLVIGLSEAEFKKIMVDNQKLSKDIQQSPAHVHNLIWKCKAEKHKFFASYSKIKYEGKECPECRKTIYKNYIGLVDERLDLVIGINESEFEAKMAQNDKLPQEKRQRPSHVLLPWKCKIKKHTWLAPYSTIKKGHGCPFCGEQARVIGLLSHPIIEYYSLKFLIDLKACQVKYEKNIVQHRKFHPDLFIYRDFNFKINIEKPQKIIKLPNKIKKVVIDFTFGSYIPGILDKCYRKYQSDDRYLIIVMMCEQIGCTVKIIQKLISEAQNITKKDHIKVISFKGYLEFLGLQKRIYNFKISSETEKKIAKKLRWVRKLSLDSFDSETEFNILIKTSKLHSTLITKYI